MPKTKTRAVASRKKSSGKHKSGRSASRKKVARRFKGHALTALVTAARALAVCVAVVALGVFCVWAVRIVFTPVHDHGQAVGNTKIGHSLRFYLDRPSIKEAIRQIGGNLALLAPIGILAPIVFPRLRTSHIALTATLVSITVESIQGTFIPGRAFDIDDVILNVIGVLAAYLLIGRRIGTLVRGHTSAGARN